MWHQFQDAPFPHRPVNPNLGPLYEELLETEAALARAIESLIAGDPVRGARLDFPVDLLDRLGRIARSHDPGAREAAGYVEHLEALKPLLAVARSLAV